MNGGWWYDKEGGCIGMERWDVAGGDKGKRKMDEGVSSKSLFVIEFGDQWKAKDLYFELKALGEIDKVVIPLGRDNRGWRFGFMRLILTQNNKTLLFFLIKKHPC